METERPVIVLVGPTASGKSSLAMHLAGKFDGEIISADSRTIYKSMDIGTAKPTPAEMRTIPHFGINLISPDEQFSAAAFKKYASQKVQEIHARRRVPFIVGGSGLYIDGYVYDFEFGAKADPNVRRELEALSLKELQAKAIAMGVDEQQVNFTNPRHLQRIIERGGVRGGRKKLPSKTLLIGLSVDKNVLNERIKKRVGKMFDDGLIEEVQKLINVYGSEAPGLLAPGYKAVVEYIGGSLSREEAREAFIRNDRNLAKRQLTWFKRNKDIHWCGNEQEAEDFVGAFLSKFDTIKS